jgi:hypothetical protein
MSNSHTNSSFALSLLVGAVLVVLILGVFVEHNYPGGVSAVLTSVQ